MFLCMDEDGNVYQAASHRADGRGVENMPHPVDDFRDNTLDRSYDKFNESIEQEKRDLKEINAMQDQASEVARAHRQKEEALKRKKKKMMDEETIDRKNQERLIEEAKSKNIGGLADFERLRIIDENYGAKHAAAMGYLDETMGRKVEPNLLQYDNEGIPYSGKTDQQIELEMMANQLKEKSDNTKEWAEYQTIPDQAISEVDLSDDGQELSVTSVEPKAEQEGLTSKLNQASAKKSKAPLLIGGAIAAYLLLG